MLNLARNAWATINAASWFARITSGGWVASIGGGLAAYLIAALVGVVSIKVYEAVIWSRATDAANYSWERSLSAKEAAIEAKHAAQYERARTAIDGAREIAELKAEAAQKLNAEVAVTIAKLNGKCWPAAVVKQKFGGRKP